MAMVSPVSSAVLALHKDLLCCQPCDGFPAVAPAPACVHVNGFYHMIWMTCNILKQICSKAETFFKEYFFFFSSPEQQLSYKNSTEENEKEERNQCDSAVVLTV